ncbi:MAG TPA: YjfB family protein [Bacillota bacterium]|nr:YjfB family protein [Bacillota bacterium]
MDDLSSIAVTPQGMRQENLQLQVQTSILKKTMDASSEVMNKLLEAMPAPPVNPPHLGQHIDFSA